MIFRIGNYFSFLAFELGVGGTNIAVRLPIIRRRVALQVEWNSDAPAVCRGAWVHAYPF
jgi:hypothetical protein